MNGLKSAKRSLMVALVIDFVGGMSRVLNAKSASFAICASLRLYVDVRRSPLCRASNMPHGDEGVLDRRVSAGLWNFLGDTEVTSYPG